MQRYIELLPILLLLAFTVKAQNPDIKFEYLTEKEGLSHNRIFSILQDREGFLWFGTWEGLNKYDGYSFTVFQPDPNHPQNTLSHNIISDMAEDKDGNLWLATRGGGLNLIEKESGLVTTYFLDTLGAHYWNALVYIYEDSKEDFWICGAGGLAKFDLRSRTFTLYPSPEDKAMIVSVAEDPMGRMWAASTSKLYQFDRTQEKYSSFELQLPSSAHFTSLHMDKEGILWIGTDSDGLYRLNTRSNLPQLVSYNPGGLVNKNIKGTLGKLYEDKTGILWLATTNGLQRIDKEKEQVTTFRSNPLITGSLSNNTVESVLMDNNGHLWVGTTNGINKWNSKAKAFQSYQLMSASLLFHLDENNITNLIEDETGLIWLGNSGKTKDSKGLGGGLFTFNPSSEEIKIIDINIPQTPPLSTNQFFVPFQDKSGKIWVGTDKALISLNQDQDKFIHYPTDIRVQTIAEDAMGQLWFGGSKGGYHFQGAVVCFNPQTNTSTYYWFDPKNTKGLNYHNISTITVASSGHIWIATPGGGINVLDPNTNNFKYYTLKQPFEKSNISDKDIRAIYEDTNGTIWIGTNQGGLNRFDPRHKKFVTYTISDGLPSNHIESILEDHKGNLWLGTSKGLSRLDPRTMTFRNYSTLDGLPDNKFYQGSKSKLGGKLLFGTTNGFVVFHPDSIKDNNLIPPVYITGLKVLEKPHPLSEGNIELSHNENFLSLEFVALDYTSPVENRYAYRLEGVDRDWINSGNRRFANYTDLKPGNYTFRVKASNNDGIWNEEGASVNITIHPPWWLSWWAYMGYGMFLVALLLLAQRETVRRERLATNMRLKQLETDKLREIDILKSRFFSNISHEFRTPLALIQGTVEKLGKKERPLSELVPGYQLIYRSADRLLQLVNQLLDLSRLEAGKLTLQPKPGEVMGFINLLMNSFTSLFENKGITFKYDLPQDPTWVFFEEDKLEKILSNLLTNACKFTPEGGLVEIVVRITQKTHERVILNVSVRDTGIGIPEELVPKIFDRFFQADLSTTRAYEGAGIGLALTKELVELHGGTISVVSNYGIGTLFSIILPLQLAERPVANIPHDFNMDKDLLQVNHNSDSVDNTSTDSHEHQTKALVLVVEDNAELRHFIKECLQDEYAVFEAADGIQGWDKALELVPDLIISDVMMPKMDGISLCQKLKSDERTSHICVILLTAKADSESKLAGLEIGADDYLTKPFQLEELLLRAHNQIEHRRRLQARFSRSLTLQPAEVVVNSLDERFLKKVLAVLEEHMSNPIFDVEMFSRETGLSRVHLHRKLKSLSGQSPGDLIRTHRLKKAATLLEHQAGNISDVAYAVGFNSLTYFSKCFKEYHGKTPSEYISGLGYMK